MAASNIHYEIADRTRATTHGGIGAIHLLMKQLGLDQAINQRLGLLKLHLPYHDSDHVLNIAYNLLAGGTCLEHLELRRSDEANPTGVRPTLCTLQTSLSTDRCQAYACTLQTSLSSCSGVA